MLFLQTHALVRKYTEDGFEPKTTPERVNIHC